MTDTDFNHKLIGMHGSLMQFAQRLTTDGDAAKDLVQETYLKVLDNREKYTYGSNFRAWIYTIMKNTFINNYRHSARRKIYYNPMEAEFYQAFFPAPADYDPSLAIMNKELNETINTLHDDFRLPFTMHVEGFRYDEIAEKLALNMGTVKSRIFSARKKLINQLKV